MTVQQAVITLVAAIISGVLATIITIIINARIEKIKIRQELVDDIFGYKYQLTNSPIVFFDYCGRTNAWKKRSCPTNIC